MNATQRKEYDAFMAKHRTELEQFEKDLAAFKEKMKPFYDAVHASGETLLGSAAVIHSRLSAIESKLRLTAELPPVIPTAPENPDQPS
jgi:hypothetical protein